MIRVIALYPNNPDVRFDHEDYESRHCQLVKERWAPWLQGIEMDRGVESPGGGPASFVAQAHLFFDSVEDFQAALAAHGDEILGDIPNFTNVEPVIQVNRVAVAREPAT